MYVHDLTPSRILKSNETAIVKSLVTEMSDPTLSSALLVNVTHLPKPATSSAVA